MKNLILSFCALCFIQLTSIAQVTPAPKGPPSSSEHTPHHPRDGKDFLSMESLAELDLSDQQLKSIKSIMNRHDEQVAEFNSKREKNELAAAEFERMRAIHMKFKSEIFSLLTVDQIMKLNESRGTYVRERIRGGKHRRNLEVLAEMDLTDEQRTKVKAIMERMRTQIDEVKAMDISEDAKRTKVHELKDAMNSDLMGIFNEEQRNYYKNELKNHQKEKMKSGNRGGRNR